MMLYIDEIWNYLFYNIDKILDIFCELNSIIFIYGGGFP